MLFVLSGAAGLIYESIWSRYLGLFVGHGAYAQILVLVIFLGGMSVGALFAGARSQRITRPLLAYALVELAAGVIGLAFHPLFDALARVAYDTVLPAVAGGVGDGAATAAKWALAGALILPQSLLLGATFPLMSAGVLRAEPRRPGEVLGLLYFANSLGAAAGVLVAGFWLVSRVGLPGTLAAAALLNLVVGAAVIALEARAGGLVQERGPSPLPSGVPPRRHAASPAPSAPHPNDAPDIVTTLPPLRTLWPLLLGASFGTAVASFVYEIAWIRMLALVLGSATHAFELMLSAFILGLALGAAWIRRRADRLRDPLATLGVVQWTMGVLAIATLPLYVASFRAVASLSATLPATDAGYVWYGAGRYALCLAVMLPATLCAGMTLPLITRVLLAAGAGERAVGAVYGVNTLGAIVGVTLAGLVLLPLLGLQRMLVAGAVVDVAIGVLLLAAPAARVARRTRRLAGIAVAATAVYVASAFFVLRVDRALLVSGVFRHGKVPQAGEHRVRFYRDGRTATVSVRDGGPGTLLTLATNGKPDASMDPAWASRQRGSARALTLGSDMSTQLLLPILTLAHAPAARRAAVIGHGSGLTSHVLLASPGLRSVETVEIEPEIVAASRLFRPANHRVFDDPRAHSVVADAKAYFAAGRRTYDVILSEPSNPWVSGVSGLFTREFYRRVRRHLAPGGVFGQWIHLYEIDDALVLSVLAALDESFPAYDVFFTGGADVLIVASSSPRLRPADWSVADLPGIRDDLRGVVPLTPETLDRLRFASAASLRPLLETVRRVNSDYDPVLDMGAERTRFLRLSAGGVRALGTERFDIAAALDGRTVGFGSGSATAVPDVPRAAGLVVGARLRARRDTPGATVVPDAGIDSYAYRVQRVTAESRGSRPPSDWDKWLAEALAVEHMLHFGTAGVADERFYADVRAFARRAGAPAPVRDALDFHHGLAAWDWREVLDASSRLVPTSRTRARPVSSELLRDGAVVAALKLGDAARARRLLAELTPRGDPADLAFRLRTRLLAAHAADVRE